VDTDNSGEISFGEFQKVAENYPDLLSGMTVSPVSWLKPKIELSPEPQSIKPNPVLEYLREILYKIDQKTFFFYTTYFLINIYLFLSTLSTYKDININTFVPLAEGFGAMLNFNGAVILLPMLRHFITKLRKTFLYNYIPIDDVVTFHRFVGHVMFFSALAHGVLYIFNFGLMDQSINYFLFFTLPGITGLSLFIILFGMWITALPTIRKGGHFKLFYFAHLGYGLWLIIFILHGPIFWKWLLVPGLLFLIERWVRSNSLVQETKVYDVSLLPSSVLGLYMERPKSFSYKPGDYLYLKCPEISEFEWHPFTISSAPENNDIISCHIRSVGSWTGNLLNYYKELPRKESIGKKIELPVLIDGPYGTPSDKVFDSKVAILVATGIGVTPYSSILKSLLHKIYSDKSGKHPDKIYFYWQNRGQNSFEWFVDLLAEIEEKDTEKFFDLNIFLTGTQSQKDMKSNMLYIAMDMKHKKSKVDLITGLKVKTNFGRPNWNQIFESISTEQKNKNIEIFFCGHPAVGKQVEITGHKYDFIFHQENF